MSQEIKLTLPTIHMNGDRAQTLLDGYRDAMEAVSTAIHKLRQCAVNGRNFYPQGPGALTKAIAEDRSRTDRLQSVYDELLTLAIHCTKHVK